MEVSREGGGGHEVSLQEYTRPLASPRQRRKPPSSLKNKAVAMHRCSVFNHGGRLAGLHGPTGSLAL